jgi:hypothetical protein
LSKNLDRYQLRGVVNFVSNVCYVLGNVMRETFLTSVYYQENDPGCCVVKHSVEFE